MDNPMYHPEKCGLTIIDTLDDAEADYSFNTAVLWKHADGTFYFGADSGCSCPEPFENVSSLSDLTVVTSVAQLRSMLDEQLFKAGKQDDDKEGMVAKYLAAGGNRG